MKSRTQSETGVQLFSRLISSQKTQTQQNNSQSKPTTTAINTQLDSKLTQIEAILKLNKKLDLDSNIFPGSLDNKNIVEIYGKNSTGKTELIMHLISRLLLPTKWEIDNTLSIDLLEFSSPKRKLQKVLLIHTESKFNMLRLFTIIENRLIKAYAKQTNQSQMPSQAQNCMNKFIKECLKNLMVYKCTNSEQLILSLSACEYFIQNQISNKTEIIPLFIDSINCNYEILDRFSHKIGLNEINHTENYTMSLLKRLIQRYNVCIISSCTEWTPQVFFNNNNNEAGRKSYINDVNKSYEKWHQIIDKQIRLYANEELSKCFTYSRFDRATEKKENVKISNNDDLSCNINGDQILLENINFKIGNIGFDVSGKNSDALL